MVELAKVFDVGLFDISDLFDGHLLTFVFAEEYSALRSAPKPIQVQDVFKWYLPIIYTQRHLSDQKRTQDNNYYFHHFFYYRSQILIRAKTPRSDIYKLDGVWLQCDPLNNMKVLIRSRNWVSSKHVCRQTHEQACAQSHDLSSTQLLRHLLIRLKFCSTTVIS